MGACLFFVSIAMVAMMGMAFSGGMTWVKASRNQTPDTGTNDQV
jgi:hypothetical protein